MIETVLEHPRKITVEKDDSNNIYDLDKFAQELERWASRASCMYRKYHTSRVVTDPTEARRILEGTEMLSFGHIHTSCIDNQTTTIYCTRREGGIVILGIYGYKLVEDIDNPQPIN